MACFIQERQGKGGKVRETVWLVTKEADRHIIKHRARLKSRNYIVVSEGKGGALVFDLLLQSRPCTVLVLFAHVEVCHLLNSCGLHITIAEIVA